VTCLESKAITSPRTYPTPFSTGPFRPWNRLPARPKALVEWDLVETVPFQPAPCRRIRNSDQAFLPSMAADASRASPTGLGVPASLARRAPGWAEPPTPDLAQINQKECFYARALLQ